MLKRYCYTVLFNLCVPWLVLHLLWRSRRLPAYRQRLEERFGYVARRDAAQPCIGLHAVSVGEIMAAKPLIKALLRETTVQVWITTTTPTGSAMLEQWFSSEMHSGRVLHSYLPYDLPDSIGRFLRRVQPCLWLVMETEIWPNWYRACAKRRIPLLLVNARLSAKSLRGYQQVGGLIRSTLADVSTLVARSAADADAFQQLGMNPARILVGGNVKFDLSVPDGLAAQAQHLRQSWGNSPVWVAGSTHEGEEKQILVVYQQLRQSLPDLKLVIVPRHPQRFAEVFALCQQWATLHDWQVIRRSESATLPETADIVLGDTLGELLMWYALADVAFIGGSLVEHGGHNPLEAAVWGVPIVTGRYTTNFADMFPDLCRSGGAIRVDGLVQLQQAVLMWLQDDDARHCAGKQARQFVLTHQGATATIMQCVHNYLAHRSPSTATTLHDPAIAY